jgi:hypothetical protein
MDKSPKTKPELEALVLAELRAAPQCGSAVHVTVVAYLRLPVSTRAFRAREEWDCATSLSSLQRRFDIAR